MDTPADRCDNETPLPPADHDYHTVLVSDTGEQFIHPLGLYPESLQPSGPHNFK